MDVCVYDSIICRPKKRGGILVEEMEVYALGYYSALKFKGKM
jgi:hypothetical protein